VGFSWAAWAFVEQFILQPAAGREDPSCREMKLLAEETPDKTVR